MSQDEDILVRIESVEGTANIIRGDDIDTDRIIPARFMKVVTFDDMGRHAFEDARKSAKGKHPLDDERYSNAEILIVGQNFGCGSSREHAPWAILDAGIRCVIAPSFGDIFYNNCFKNGILPIQLPKEQVDLLMDDAERGANAVVSIDLEKQEITGPDGGTVHFEIDPFRKHCLLNALDDIGLTLAKTAAIDAFETRQRAEKPWLYA